jgi:Raf kinase inhibitor-like YbhB/YbcL family protein
MDQDLGGGTFESEAEERPDWARDLVSFELRAEAFSDGGTLPTRFTADGEELSPALAWGKPPDGTRSLALLVEDLDAPSGSFTHWMIVSLPPAAGDLVEGRGSDPSDVAGAQALTNDYGDVGWGPPSPPPGPPHRYRFRLLALDFAPKLPATAKRPNFDAACAGRVIAEASLTATYGR